MALTGLHVDSNARERVLNRALALVGAMRVALSPKSSSHLIDAEWRAPVACNDRATFTGAAELELAEITKV